MVESIITKEACIKCNGEGMIYSMVDILIEVKLLWVECPRCGGTGYEKEDDKEPIK